MYVGGVRKRGSWVISILEEGSLFSSSFSSLPVVFSSSSSSSFVSSSSSLVVVVVVVVVVAVLLLFHQGRTSGKEEEMTSLQANFTNFEPENRPKNRVFNFCICI